MCVFLPMHNLDFHGILVFNYFKWQVVVRFCWYWLGCIYVSIKRLISSYTCPYWRSGISLTSGRNPRSSIRTSASTCFFRFNLKTKHVDFIHSFACQCHVTFFRLIKFKISIRVCNKIHWPTENERKRENNDRQKTT